METITVYLLVIMFSGHWGSQPMAVPNIVSETECFRLADTIKRTQSEGKNAGVQCYPYQVLK